MKSKLLLLSFLMLLSTIVTHSQSAAFESGIAVQGIARDANNTAIPSQSISFKFELYYFNSSNQEMPIYSETVNIQTDAFGVFSHVVDAGVANNPKISNNLAYLRITKGASEIISNQKLRHVPYAISANNGVPIGSILPFIGTTAPPGWAICNGDPLPSYATELIAMVGANAPDLQGMFLRGTGTSPVNGEAGPALKGTQDDGFEAHNHNGLVGNNGNHAHGYSDDVRVISSSEPGTAFNGGNNFVSATVNQQSKGTNAAGIHNHVIANDGINETRPVNFGVNYIIKL